VDSTDFYMFNSYEAGRTGYVTLLANYIPLQDPYGGPNYFALDSTALAARVIELGVWMRVRVLALPYGDQGLFVRREAFEALHGYADLPIMEDVDLVRRLRARGRLFRSPLPVVTSARRWERDGWIRRTVRHLVLIVLYFCGVAPSRLMRLDRARHL